MQSSMEVEALCNHEEAEKNVPCRYFTEEEVRSVLNDFSRLKDIVGKRKKLKSGNVKVEGEIINPNLEEVGSALSDFSKLKSVTSDFLKTKRVKSKKGRRRRNVKVRKQLINPMYFKYTEEEIRKLWVQKCHIPAKRPVTRKYSLIALQHFNEENFTDYELVDGVNMNTVYVGRAVFVLHLNFKAKKPNDDIKDAALFFAEFTRLNPPHHVSVCAILDVTTNTQSFCLGCAPEQMIQHLLGKFHTACEGPHHKRLCQASTFECLSELTELERCNASRSDS